MAIITKFTTVEYGQNSELSQLSEGDCSRYDARKLPVVKDLNCVVYEMKRILGHSQNIDEAAFFGKYGRLLEIAKIGVLNPTIKALIKLLGSRLQMLFLWKCGFVSHYRGIWNVDGVSQTLAPGLFSFEKRQGDS